jgi:Cu(I)/Ag(I) efflux system membrane fusion protein
MHPQIVRNEPELPYLRNDFSPKVTDKQAVESHSIEHLLRPTDSFFVGIMQVQAQSIPRLVAL